MYSIFLNLIKNNFTTKEELQNKADKFYAYNKLNYLEYVEICELINKMECDK